MIPKRKILIVDDEAALRTVIAQVLVTEGYEVRTAANGEEAADMVQVEDFDLMLVDLIMPRKDGFQTILSIHRSFPNMRLVAMSGGAGRRSENFLRMAARAGAGQTLSKPFAKTALLTAIETELSRQACGVCADTDGGLAS